MDFIVFDKEDKRQNTELYSIKEKMVYTRNNAVLIKVNGVLILATPKGEPLVNRVK